jgi:DMSO/TMAO reductase YedYZ molybdopterin-dependent catalytic subunit
VDGADASRGGTAVATTAGQVARFGAAPRVPLTLGRMNDKLIEAKRQWAREGRLLTGTVADPENDRLPPGQLLVRDWPVLDLGAEPDVTPQKFRLDIDGAVENRLSLSLEEFMALPQSESVSDIHCVTQWSRYDNRWRGVVARALVEIVRPRPEARHVLFHSFDGYTANVLLEQFDQPDVFLVHEWEGKPLTRAHGGPVRMLVPRLYFWKSAKWLRRIQFTISDHPGFWEQRGYHNNGDPWLEERYG